MNLQDIKRLVVATVPGTEGIYASGIKVEIVMDDGFLLGLAHLEALAVALGTKEINIHHIGQVESYAGYVEIIVTMAEPVT